MQSKEFINIYQNYSQRGMDSSLTLNSPLNKSKSKFMYSFSKEERFSTDKTTLKSRVATQLHDSISQFYEKPSCLSKRSTSIGYGQKYALYKNDDIKKPSPDKYNIPSQFDLAIQKKRGISFGIGRQESKSFSIFNQSNFPGPAQYNNTPNFPTKKYSIREKVKFPRIDKESITPGPGKYQTNPDQFSRKGQQYIANMKSSIKFTIKKSQKQNQSPKTKNIGPGYYKIDYSSFSKQIQAKYRTKNGISFNKQCRNRASQEQKPGPGKYSHFSQFGNLKA